MYWFNVLKAKIMRKSYISPVSETMMVHSIDTICAASGTKTIKVETGVSVHEYNTEGLFK